MAGENALLSVYDKTGIVDFAAVLHELKWNLFASGGTAKQVDEAGIPVEDVAELVGGEAILGHRVVTLSREVHAGLLADQRSDMQIEELESLGIPFLGLVAVDMYPLREAIAAGLSEPEVTEKTDVGGPTMLHSAAKGRRIALSLAPQRAVVGDWLKGDRSDDENIRRILAATAEGESASYIKASEDYLRGLVEKEAPQSTYAGRLRQIGKFR